MCGIAAEAILIMLQLWHLAEQLHTHALWLNGQTTATATGLTAGTYYFTVYDNNNCSVTGAVIISSASTLSCNTNSTPANCNQSDGTATVNAFGGTLPYSYLWNNGQSAPVATGLTAGTYTVTVTDGNGCSSVCTVVVVQPSSVSFQLTSTDASCGNSNGSASANNVNGGYAPYSYLWSDGQTTSVANGLAAGTYTVTVTDNTGCSSSQNVVIGQACRSDFDKYFY